MRAVPCTNAPSTRTAGSRSVGRSAWPPPRAGALISSGERPSYRTGTARGRTDATRGRTPSSREETLSQVKRFSHW